MPARRQAIIWTNDGSFTDAYVRYSASMSFNKTHQKGSLAMKSHSWLSEWKSAGHQVYIQVNILITSWEHPLDWIATKMRIKILICRYFLRRMHNFIEKSVLLSPKRACHNCRQKLSLLHPRNRIQLLIMITRITFKRKTSVKLDSAMVSPC